VTSLGAIDSVTDDLLVARARKGDPHAVDALLRAHYDTVRAVCHRIVINRADAEDATQHALMAIVRALPTFDGRSKFSTWAYRIATNAALDEVRRVRRRPIPAEDPFVSSGSVPLTTDSTRDGSSAVESQMVVREALAALPEEFRTVIVLRHIADLDYDEIAETLDVPVGTVRSRLSRGRSQLADILGNQSETRGRQTIRIVRGSDPSSGPAIDSSDEGGEP
jgi:RNA polymerase sigma-70 factor (ECF subfamily)